MQNNNEQDSQLENFFQDELKDIYWAEKHLVKVIPQMVDATTSDELKSALNGHLQVTKGHVSRLENIFKLLNLKPQAVKCKAMQGITDEGDEIIDDTEEGSATRDVGIILAAQKVEHYEIATYGGLIQIAKTLEHEDIAKILNDTLSEEKEADQTLSQLAENTVNEKAAHEQEH